GYGTGTKEDPPPEWRGIFGFSFSEGSLHFRGEVGTGLELHHLLGSDLDLLTGLRVAAFAGSTLGDGESTEADEGNALAFLQCLGGAVHECIQCALRISLRDLRFCSARFDQFRFVQAHGCWFLSWLV